MATLTKSNRSITKGCHSETGKLRKVVMCPPTHFQIVKPMNAIQWLYYSDGLPEPEPPTVVTIPFSEVIKSGDSVRCDTLPVERES